VTRLPSMRMIAPLAVVVAALVGSCTEIGTNPTTITALQFDTLPFPAVVTGDSLRDSLGRAAPLHAIAFNATGGVVANAALTYLALDSGLTIDANGFVTAQRRNGTVRVIASAPGLQSVEQSIVVARRPDSVMATSALVDTLLYDLPDNPGTNFRNVALKITTNDTVGGITGTQGWLVSYQVLFHGRALATTDTLVASLWGASSNTASLVDTTAAGGAVSARLRVRPAGLPTATESVTVVATVRYRGGQVRGSPVTYLIQIRPKPK